MSYKWLLTAALVAAGMSATLTRAQTELSASPVAAKSHATPSAPLMSDSSAASSSAWLETIKVQPQSQGMRFEIKTSSAVKPIVTAVPDPNRLVIDFPNTISAYAENRIPVDHDGVKAVRIGVQPVVPPVTRVVLDLDRPRNYQVASNGATVTVNLDDAIAADYSPAENSSRTVAAAPTPAKESVSANTGDPVLTANTASDRTGSSKISSSNDLPAQSSGGRAASNTSGTAPLQQAARHSNAPSHVPGHAPVQVASAASVASAPGASNSAAPAAPDDPPGDVKSSPAVPQAAPISSPSSVAGQTKLSAQGSPEPKPVEVASGRSDLELSKSTVNHAVPNPASDQYIIGEQDVLTIVVWKERELSGTVTVRPDGKITLPLVDEIKVVGMTPAQLQAILTEKFKPFVNIPQVTVEVNQINSRKVYLIGEVQKTGSFPVNSSTTVLQVIADAGGLRDFAKRKKIYILRNTAGKQVRYPFSYDDVIRGRKPQQNIVVQPGDLIVVP